MPAAAEPWLVLAMAVSRSEVSTASAVCVISSEKAATAARNFDNVGPLLVLHSAGLEYQQMLNGRLHYALYLRTNPWDHAPGQLLLAEAGGFTARLDGSAYDINVIMHTSPMVAAVGEASWQALRKYLFGMKDDI